MSVNPAQGPERRSGRPGGWAGPVIGRRRARARAVHPNIVPVTCRQGWRDFIVERCGGHATVVRDGLYPQKTPGNVVRPEVAPGGRRAGRIEP